MKAIVVAGGEPDPADAALLNGADLLVAADGGAAWLDRSGARPHILVGDLDSVAPALVERLEAEGVTVERHPTDKDASDAELAIVRAVAGGADVIVLLGALGGLRPDHELANLLLLTDARFADHDLRIVRGGSMARALHAGKRLSLDGAPGSLVTLMPIGGDAGGVHTAGLRFSLQGDDLPMGRSRGLSNVVELHPASVTLERGTLLVVETATKE